ncbi:MAG: flagella basal body P-ring formation protein FlgA [Edaphobacter sp.]
MAEGKGYRVTSIRWDPVLNQRWATVVRCGHPEWPSLSLRTGETNTASRLPVTQIQEEDAQSGPLVHAGDIVHLWRQENLLRIEVTGVAEESGRLGKLIRVRLLRRDTDDQSIEEQFTGIVRGPADVEMQR